MPADEFQRWREFYTLFPFDDLHRYHRPAALIASRRAPDVQESLDWLQPPGAASGVAGLMAIPGVKFHPRKEA